MGGVGKGVGTLTVYPLYFGIFVLLKKFVLKCVPSFWIHRKGHHKWLLIMSQILLLSSQPKKMSQIRKTRYSTTLDKTCWNTSVSQKYLCLTFPVVLPKMETVAKWMPDFSPPFNCTMLFRITRESHIMIFRPKEHWIGVWGVGRVSYFFCLEEMDVWHKS